MNSPFELDSDTGFDKPDTVSSSAASVYTKKDLPFCMKNVPLGWPLMSEAFLSFVSFALDSEKVKKEYMKMTNVDLNQFKNQSILEQMIDDKTGYAEETLSNYMDWLVDNYWGAEA